MIFMANKSGMILGIDECHRSDVLGSLIVCGFVCEEEEQKALYELGVRDSKMIQYKIKKIAKMLKNYPHKVYRISAEEISNCENLNELEGKYYSKIIKWAIKNYNIDRVYMDTIAANPETTKLYLDNFNIDMIIEKQADEKYPCVMAASCIAKDVSDREMKILRKKFNCGSGVPNDNQTREFIKNAILNQDEDALKIIRKNWITYRRIKNET